MTLVVSSNKMRLLFFITIIFYLVETVNAQNNNEPDGLDVELRSSVYTATEGELPFWFYSGVYGTVDPGSTNFLNEISFQQSIIGNSKISLDAGGNAVLRWSEDSTILFPQLYLTGRALGLKLDIGRFPQPIGLNNHDLSVGSMMVSRNAMPVPKISISVPEFRDVPLTDGYLQYKGMFTHGWLEKDRHVESPYLHQKYFYLRVNVGPLSGTGGIVHNAQWGGTDPDLGRLPQSFNDYIRLVTGQGADASSNAPGGEKSNVIGNSVAAYEFGLQYDHNEYTINLTRLFYLEDKVSTRFRSPWDGVWGVNLAFDDKTRWLNAVTYEHINTKNQDAKSWELIGRRDYYDNFVYSSGWTYENRTLGIPLIIFDGNTISNNVLVGHHLGLKGNVGDDLLSWRSLFTWSRNYGVQDDWVERSSDSIPKDREDIIPREQFQKDQLSWLLSLEYDIQNVDGLYLNVNLAVDTGELYSDNLGLMMGVTWR
ncbi:capsule assembly Wzi family protein [Aliifodinibius sp. S!AR15-10]|uniref:capsule assembly Wzi family protein n=1 Tax=Aliifodinibius sp. S!AR15-10 TaxID=2950437 RepID=UPI002863C6AA|nr:capsule assembly Wzi family protein [Aliifodinibius sp. S!AR15-10]MDR8393501.1 capsule assembly Wzi family protein [Aliifodinibius sp. S!AR15-10]